MFNITNEGIISLSRGDSVSMPLFINAGSDVYPIRYELKDNDILYLGICLPEQLFENAILKKVYTSDNWVINEHGDLVVSLTPNDTELLAPGLYYYIMKLVTVDELDNSEKVQTIIKKTKFFIED